MTPTNRPRYRRQIPHALLDRRSVLRGILLAGGAATFGTALAACGSDDDGNDPAAESPDDTAAPANGEAPLGGELTVGIGSEVADFDPYNHLAVNFPMMNTLYSYLITYDDDFTPHPDLAEAWEMAEDGMSVEITLRDTVFHDGSFMTGQVLNVDGGWVHY